MNLLLLPGVLTPLVYWVLVGVKAWAFVDAATRPGSAFTYADKLTKAAWLWITGLALLAEWPALYPGPVGLVSMVGTVAAFVYLLDVRPAVAQAPRSR